MKNIEEIETVHNVNDRVGFIFNSDKTQIIGYRRKPDLDDFIHIANIADDCAEYPFDVFADCERYPVTVMFFMRPFEDSDEDDDYIKQTDIAGYFVASNVGQFTREDIIHSIQTQIDLIADIQHLDDEKRADLHDDTRCFILSADDCARCVQNAPHTLPVGYRKLKQARQTTLTDTPEKKLLLQVF